MKNFIKKLFNSKKDYMLDPRLSRADHYDEFLRKKEHNALDELLKPETKAMIWHPSPEWNEMMERVKFRYEAITHKKLKWKYDNIGEILLLKVDWKKPVYEVDHMVDLSFTD